MYSSIVKSSIKSASPVISSVSTVTKIEKVEKTGTVYKAIICEHFLQGKCKHNDSCHFSHSVDPEINLDDIDFNKYKTCMCKRIVDGNECTLSNFNICLFAHSEDELLMPICRFNQKCRNDNCNFRHYNEQELEEFIQEQKTILRENRREAAKKIDALHKPKQQPIKNTRTPRVKIDLSPSIVSVKEEVKTEVKEKVKESSIEVKEEKKEKVIEFTEIKNEMSNELKYIDTDINEEELINITVQAEKEREAKINNFINIASQQNTPQMSPAMTPSFTPREMITFSPTVSELDYAYGPTTPIFRAGTPLSSNNSQNSFILSGYTPVYVCYREVPIEVQTLFNMYYREAFPCQIVSPQMSPMAPSN